MTKESMEVMEEENIEAKQCYLSDFKEADLIMDIVRNVKEISKNNVEMERNYQTFNYVVSLYQEQPHLLDPYLKEMVGTLLGYIRNEADDVVLFACKLLYVIVKTRGHKRVMVILPHQVEDLHFLINTLNNTNDQNFERDFIYLMWLYIVCLIPFHFNKLDLPELTGNAQVTSSIESVINISKRYLGSKTRCREMGAGLLARFVSRPDVKEHHLEKVVQWVRDTISTASSNSNSSLLRAGCLNFLAHFFKHAHRKDLANYGESVYNLLDGEWTETVDRKMVLKILQRVALSMLPPKLAAWRYTMGRRTLAESLKVTNHNEDMAKVEEEEEDDDEDVDDLVEQVVHNLLEGLKDSQTTVRWTCAKGIGRIASRLSKSLANQVMDAVFECFEDRHDDSAWHGGCLCLGELCHRGVILEEHLDKVVDLVDRGLSYEEKRGSCSVGCNVRDASSFIAWSLARAYHLNNVEALVSSLIVTSLFDREITVRRAASAALQELVGRQSTIRHGIFLITTCDYHAVGNINNTYLSISGKVSDIDEEYKASILDHLMHHKLAHWHLSIRRLVAESLASLVEYNFERFCHKELYDLLDQSTSSSTEVLTRHSCILACAHVIPSMCRHAGIINRSFHDVIAPFLSRIEDLLKELKQLNIFRGINNDILTEAVCVFIRKVYECCCGLISEEVYDSWLQFTFSCIKTMDLDLQEAAIDAFSSLLCNHPNLPTDKLKGWLEESLKILKIGKLSGKLVRRGILALFCRFPRRFYNQNGDLNVLYKEVVNNLITHALYPEKSILVGVLSGERGGGGSGEGVDDGWVDEGEVEKRLEEAKSVETDIEERVEAVKSLGKIILAQEGKLDGWLVGWFYGVAVHNMDDYTRGEKGDVGARVREGTMEAIEETTCHLANHSPHHLSTHRCRLVMSCLLKQSCEKIDRTRGCAFHAILALLSHQPSIEAIPEKSILDKLLLIDPADDVNWKSAASTFKLLTPLITTSSKYSYPIILGICLSAGGLSQSTVKHSATALVETLSTSDQSGVFSFFNNVIRGMRDFRKVFRVTLPMMICVQHVIITSTCLRILPAEERDSLLRGVLTEVLTEVARTKDVKRVFAAVDLICTMMCSGGEALHNQCATHLINYLVHPYPLVRNTTATKLYEALLTSPYFEEDDEGIVSDVLLNTNWTDSSINELKEIKKTILQKFKIQISQ